MANNDNPENYISSQHARRLKRFVLALTITALLAAAVAGSYSLFRYFHPHTPYQKAKQKGADPLKTSKHVRINGYDYDIPVGYFKNRIPNDTKTDVVLLKVMFPQFKPPDHVEWKSENRKKWRNHVSILAHSPEGKTNIQEKYKFHKDFLYATRYVGDFHGLKHYRAPKDKNSNRGILYVERGKHDQLEGLIRCSDPEISTHSQCSYLIWTKYFFYEISFDKDLLKHWKEIRHNVVSLMQRFRRDNENPSNKKG